MERSMTSPNPLQNREHLRICHIRAIESTSSASQGEPVLDMLDFGRLAPGLESAGDLAPQLAAVSTQSNVTLTGSRSGDAEVDWHRYRITIPGGGLVDARIISKPWDSLGDAISLLEDFAYESIDGEPTEWDAKHTSGCSGEPDSTLPFHQLVLLPDSQQEPDWETIQRLIYRADLDAIEEQSAIGHPEELNRRPGQLAAVGRFGSVLWGVQDYVEASALLSASLVVSAASNAKSVRAAAHTQLARLRNAAVDDSHNGIGETLRAVADLGADLTFGAEAPPRSLTSFKASELSPTTAHYSETPKCKHKSTSPLGCWIGSLQSQTSKSP